MTESFERTVTFRPAFDKRDPDPKKNYGIHGVDIVFLLKGARGAYQFCVSTNWHLPNVQAEQDTRPLNEFPYMFHKPMPTDLGYHAHAPQYVGHEPMSEQCEVLGGKCYYDGSSLAAEDVFNILLSGGSDAVWKHLEERYMERFYPVAV